MPQLQQPVDWTAGYRAERERSRGEMTQRANYAAAIAESLGYYTPELQQRVLEPMGKYPTIGESLFSAPVRGLGKLLGSERMQQVGAPQPFELTGTPPPAPMMPKTPEGVPPEIQSALQMMGTSLGYQPYQDKPTIPNLPSETIGPRLKTKIERESQTKMQDKAWEFITKHYQSEEEKAKANAYIDYMKSQAEYGQANAEYKRALVSQGLPKTQWDLIYNEMKATGKSYSDIQAKIRAASKSKAAELQLYEKAKEQGYSGTIVEFRQDLKKTDYDLIKLAGQIFAKNPWATMENTEEEQAKKILELANGLAEGLDSIERNMIEQGESLNTEKPGQRKLPPELLNMGITPGMIAEEAASSGRTEDEEIQRMMNFYGNAYGGGAR